jgi:AcrR family transcriptional regulator
MVEAITRTTLVHRTRSALYRWQGRYLTPEDRAAVTEVDVRVRRRLADAVLRRRQRHHGERPPGASSTAASSDVAAAGAGSAAAAILSCIASLGHHRIELSDDDAVALMTSIADLLALAAVAPTARPLAITAHTGSTTVRLRGGAATREGAIEAAIARFHSSGYDSVTMEAIGADVGVAASALYRHFSGKPALLTAAVDRTGTLVEGLLDSHAALHSSGTDPAVALEAMLWQYVGIAFSHGPDLMLYHSELGSLDPEDRRRLRQAQRRQLDRWAGLVLASAAEADGSIARIRVHAALAVVLDGGQGTGFDPAAAGRFGQLAGLILLPRR